MLKNPDQSGVTLIELLIGIAIVSMLLMAGVPMFGSWIQNTQVRTAAESIQNGLQIARSEAVMRNANVRFALTSADGLVAWNVGCVTVRDSCPATIQTRIAAEGGGNARVGVSTVAPPGVVPVAHYSVALVAGAGLSDEGGASNNAGVTFNGMGIVPNAGTDVTRIDVINSVSADARRLVIVVGSGGLTRMCDPQLALSSNAQGCS